VVQATEEPPTYFRTNKFTQGFQALIDAYGMARYREVNPGVFAIITFPFLFAVMFGDVGHAIMMCMFAGYMIYKEKELSAKKLNEMVDMAFQGRYLLMLMGLFSIYTGLLYNEFFSMPLDLFGTNWQYVGNATTATPIDPNRTYPFGVDPTWGGSSNSLTFYNSMKMKMSVVLGVTQMVLGISLSFLNAIHFRKTVDIVCECIPQLLFMLSLFGYLVFLILFKWATPRSSWKTNPPFLLNVMIDMFLSITSVSAEDSVYSGQLYVQWVLITTALVCVPWMLLIKPYYLRFKHKRNVAMNSLATAHESLGPHATSLIDDDSHHHQAAAAAPPQQPSSSHEHGNGEGFDFGEIFIHQIIHTIEFVLGAVSNTASYLRLWALSLAHSELSIVFWDRVLMLPFTSGMPVALAIPMEFVCFAVWAAATAGVLLTMESLSAFLHALRLHWVEFQNKFYHADGRRFVPFSYEALLSGKLDE